MPVPDDRYGNSKTAKDAPSLPATTSQATEPSFDLRWEEALRFAGKPFDVLSFTAAVDKPTEIKIVLCNIGKNPILVRNGRANQITISWFVVQAVIQLR